MIAIGTRVRIRPEYHYLIEHGQVTTGWVADRWVATLGEDRTGGDMPMLRIFRDSHGRSEEWSENMWESIE